MPSVSRSLTLLLLLAAALACGDASGPAANDDVATVTVRRADAAATVWAGDTARLVAVARTAAGATLPDDAVAWASGDESIATVAHGIVTARRAGTVTISATAGGQRGELAIVVTGMEMVYEGWPSGTPAPYALEAADGAVPVRLFPAGTVALDPTPSPDGSRIAFVVANYVEDVADIYVADRDGRNVRQLTSEEGVDDQPSWSPDGQRIAYRSFSAGYDGDVWVMQADGSAKVNLTPDPLPGITDEARPAWSPDALHIAYTSTAGGFSRNIWRMDADGQNKTRLTTAPTEVETEAAWSPDGTRIAYRRGTAASDIVVMNADGTGQVRLEMPGIQRQPAWSPNGRLIAYVGHATTAARPELFTMRPDGTGIVARLADPALGAGLEPSWRRR